MSNRSGKELKELARQGIVTPETIVETEEGKQAPARKVKGLTFDTLAQCHYLAMMCIDLSLLNFIETIIGRLIRTPTTLELRRIDCNAPGEGQATAYTLIAG